MFLCFSLVFSCSLIVEPQIRAYSWLQDFNDEREVQVILKIYLFSNQKVIYSFTSYNLSGIDLLTVMHVYFCFENFGRKLSINYIYL